MRYILPASKVEVCLGLILAKECSIVFLKILVIGVLRRYFIEAIH